MLSLRKHIWLSSLSAAAYHSTCTSYTLTIIKGSTVSPPLNQGCCNLSSFPAASYHNTYTSPSYFPKAAFRPPHTYHTLATKEGGTVPLSIRATAVSGAFQQLLQNVLRFSQALQHASYTLTIIKGGTVPLSISAAAVSAAFQLLPEKQMRSSNRF